MGVSGIFLLFGLCNIIIPQHGAGTAIHDKNESEIEILSNEIINYVLIDEASQKSTTINDISTSTNIYDFNSNRVNDSELPSLCVLCKALSKAIIFLRRNHVSEMSIQKGVSELCTFLRIQTKNVCYGVISLNIPSILYIIDHDAELDENDICSVLLQDQPCVLELPERYKWSIDVNAETPKITNVKPSENHFKIVQITDIHYDPLYEPGGSSICGEPTCCRKGQNSTDNVLRAGYWGDFNNCDSPWHAVVDALSNIKEQQKNIDWIYFTGDVIDHGVWETTFEGNTKSLKQTFYELQKTFGDVPVYPVLGNHESHPLNLFAPNDIQDEKLSTYWLYELLADIWINNGWLPESVRETILRGGFYTVSPKKGFRVIGINNNVCNIYNWWYIHKPVDPSGQLQWLMDTLLEAEKSNELVHILGHIPAGSNDCQQTWSREFRRIINRFSHIITGQFNGHTHNDEFNVFYAFNDTSKIINVAWNGGSITPYANLNPNYKTYLVNANTYAVEDAETWIYNLTEANEMPEKKPNWFNSYSFKNQYNLDNLSTDNLHKMIVQMAKGSPTLKIYHKNFFKHAAPELENECNESCLQSYICRIVTSSSGYNKDCEYFQAIHGMAS